MKKISVLLGLCSVSAFAGPSDCKLPSAPVSVSKTVRVWQLSASDVFEETVLPNTQGYEDFSRWAAKQPNLENPLQKIQAERDDYEKVGQLTPDIAGRLDPILSGKIGVLRPIHCLEALMMGEADSLRPMPMSPYEIAVVVLRRKNSPDTQMKVYLTLGDATSVGMEGVEPLVKKDLKAGWVVETHMHNHPFSTDEPYVWNGGYTAPSGNDISFYKLWINKYSLPEARITNGVFTVVLTAGEISQMN